MADNGTPLSIEEILGLVALSGKRMSNGEVRTRLLHEGSGLSVSITSTLEGGSGWQNSHRHLSDMRETYCIQKGEVVLVTQREDTRILICRRFGAGSTFTIDSGNPHNVYVSIHTIFATTKYGSQAGRTDWEAWPELDKIITEHSSLLAGEDEWMINY